MATIKIKYRKSTVDGKEGTVYFKVIHNRVARQINTVYKLLPHEWDDANGKVFQDDAPASRKAYLEKISCGIIKDKLRLEQIVQQFDLSAKPYTADNVVTEFLHPSPQRDFILYAMAIHQRTQSRRKTGCAESCDCIAQFHKVSW